MCISPGDSSRDLSIPYLVGGYLSGLDFWSPLTIAKKGHQELPGIYSRKPTNVDTEKASLLIQEISSRTKRHQFSGAFRRGLSGVGIYISFLVITCILLSYPPSSLTWRLLENHLIFS